jgi:hypothetical protein
MTQQEKPQRVQIDWVELFGAIDIEIAVMRNGEPVAFLIPYTAYLAREDHVEALEDEIIALRAELAIARGEETVTDIDPDTFLSEILSDAIPA